MVIGVLSIELEIAQANSLKEKRMVVNRVRDLLRRKFNVAVAEVESLNVWNHAGLAVVAVSNEQKFCNQVLSQAVNLLEADQDGYVLGEVGMEFL
ncbi:MAG: DUF503 domain-containing protein [Lentisphaeria bacterium]|jgi:hypothetical protein